MRVVFKQIAIFDTQTVFLFLEKETSGLSEFCTNWGIQALSKGADAFLIRDSLGDEDFFQTSLISILSVKPPTVPLMCNHKAQSLLPGTQGVHYKRGNIRGISLSEGYAGISAHSTEGCKNAERNGFDYVFISPVFPTKSHPGEAALGLDKLSRICASVHIPVFALGGITETNMSSCFVAGIKGTASISLYMPK
jgi:thiamine monophosphate synthase